jgi:hypothetical protein
MPADLLVSWNDGAAKRTRGFRRAGNQKGLAAEYTDLISGFARSTANTNCPEVDGLNVQFPYEHEECHGCGMC